MVLKINSLRAKTFPICRGKGGAEIGADIIFHSDKSEYMKKLFFDDIRTPEMVYDTTEATDFIVVTNYVDFVQYIKQNGLPEFISFDNDLGLDENEKWPQMDMQLQSGWSMRANRIYKI